MSEATARVAPIAAEAIAEARNAASSARRRMVDVLPQGELVAVPGVGHAPTLVEPAVLAALERFLGAPDAVASRE